MPKKIQIPARLQPLFKPKRYKIAIGGRGSGKSTSIARALLIQAMLGKRIGCFREYQNSISDSVHRLLADEITNLDLPGFSILKSEITHVSGGEFKFKGLSRGLDAVKSAQGFNIFWVEEAQFLSEMSINILTPTLREEGSELWFSGNPMSSADPFSQKFILPFRNDLDRDKYFEDDLHIAIFANYDDNPFFPDVLEQERRHDKLTLDRALYSHTWEGAFNDSVANSIIKAEWFDSCIDAHKKIPFQARGLKVAAHDPSDLGDDAKGYCVRHGSVVLQAESNDYGDVNEGCDWAIDKAIKDNVDVFTWDADGLGLSLKRQINEAFADTKIKVQIFRGSNSPERPDDIYQEPGKSLTIDTARQTNKQTFRNLRAQRYWMLRDRVYNTYLAVEKEVYTAPDEMISFSTSIKDMTRLRSEICRLPRKFNANGLIQMMTKDEMKRLLRIDSPNIADSVMMSLFAPAANFNANAEVQTFINKNRQLRRLVA